MPYRLGPRPLLDLELTFERTAIIQKRQEVRHVLIVKSFQAPEIPPAALDAVQTSVTLAWVGGVLNLLFMIFAVIMLARIYKLASARAKVDRVDTELSSSGPDAVARAN